MEKMEKITTLPVLVADFHSVSKNMDTQKSHFSQFAKMEGN